MVFVLGDPVYYGRFGFTPALAHGLVPPHELAEPYREAWMVNELTPGKLIGCHGRVRCPDSISDLQYWQE